MKKIIKVIKNIISMLKEMFGPARKLVPGSDEEKAIGKAIKAYLDGGNYKITTGVFIKKDANE